VPLGFSFEEDVESWAREMQRAFLQRKDADKLQIRAWLLALSTCGR